MSHTPHELAEEFPEFVEKMSALKVSDAHYAKMQAFIDAKLKAPGKPIPIPVLGPREQA